MRTHLPVGGTELEKEIRATPPVRPHFIEGLVLEESSVLAAAPPGSGKTSILYSMLVTGSNGLPVFGHLHCPRPLRFYVFCPERRAVELRERIRHALDLGIPVNMNNIYFDDGMTGLADFADATSIVSIRQGIDYAIKHHYHGQTPDIVCIEGLHAMSLVPMVDPRFGRYLMSFNSMIHKEYRASLWYSSHTKKQQRDQKGDLQDLDFLGGILIPAIMTGYYLFERLPDQGPNKSHMTQKKDTVSGLCDELAFTYDPETMLLTLDGNSPQVKSREKFRLFLNSCLRENRTFTHAELIRVGGVSQSTVTREICQRLKESSIINTSPPGSNGIYKVLKLV